LFNSLTCDSPGYFLFLLEKEIYFMKKRGSKSRFDEKDEECVLERHPFLHLGNTISLFTPFAFI